MISCVTSAFRGSVRALADPPLFLPQTFLVVLFCLTSLWTATFTGLAIIVGYRFTQELPQSALMLKVLRSVAMLSTTTLFLPSTSILFRSAYCPAGEVWHGTAIECFGPSYMVILVTIVVLLSIFCTLCLIVAAVFIDQSVTSESWDAKTTGRVELVMLVFKVGFAFVFNVIEESTPMPVLALVLLFSAVMWVGLNVRRMPCIHNWVDELTIGLASMYAWAAIWFAVCVFTHMDVGIIIITGMPFAGLAVAYSLGAWTRYLVSTPLAELTSANHIDLWARHRAVHAEKLERHAKEAGMSHQQGDSPAAAGHRPGHLELDFEKHRKLLLDEAEAGFKRMVSHCLSAVHNRRGGSSGDGSMLCEAYMRTAQFYKSFKSNHFQELTMLHKAAQTTGSFLDMDIQFFV